MTEYFIHSVITITNIISNIIIYLNIEGEKRITLTIKRNRVIFIDTKNVTIFLQL